MQDEISTFERAKERALSVIRDGTIGSLASASGGKVGLCAVFYVRLGGNRLAFKSRRSSEHMRNLTENPQGAMLVYLHTSTYASKLGVQMRGVVREALEVSEMEAIVRQYSRCFEGAGRKLPSPTELLLKATESTFFVFEARSYKLVDESPSDNLTMSSFSDFADLSDCLEPGH